MFKLILKNPITEWILWVYRLARTLSNNKNKQLKIKYLASASEDCVFGKYNIIYERAQLSKVALGDFSYVASHTKISRTNIGKFCCLGPEVIIGLGFHPSKGFIASHPVFYSLLKQSGITFAKKQFFNEYRDTVIENDVWIGARSIILDGVKIGNGAIIAAGSVVTKDIPPYAIVGGVPTKLIRYRFSHEQIQLIESSRWWDRDIDWLKDNYELFHDFEVFKKYFQVEINRKNH